ncbi:MAG: hypothetical protein JO076_00320 [Verrucomicrobia bacterium]|nr:hypothetical protein [Verrucomicrobiota bacterium]
MAEYFGGYIFFPTIPDRNTLIQLVLDIIEASPTDTQAIEEIWLYDGEDTTPTDLPAEQALIELAKTEEGAMYVHTKTLEDVAFWFEPPVKGHQTITVWGYSMGLTKRKDRENLGNVNAFIDSWLALCEKGRADFGFFGKYLQTIEKTYRDQVLPALLNNDVEALMSDIAIYWLVYLGSEQARRWRLLHKELPAFDRQTLPSGALFVRMSKYLYD